MSNKEDRIADSIRRNTGRLCSAPGCHMSRTRVSSYCAPHNAATHWYGHPQGKHIDPKLWATELAEASRFIEAHITHRGITQAVAWFDEWLSAAQEASSKGGNLDAPVVAAQDMARLADMGIQPLQLLKTVAGLWLFAQRNPHTLQDDNRLTVALSLAVLKLAPRYYRIDHQGKRNPTRYTAEARKLIGKRVRDTIGLLIRNIIATIETLPNEKEVFKNNQNLPFELSPSLVLSEQIPEPIQYIEAPLD